MGAEEWVSWIEMELLHLVQILNKAPFHYVLMSLENAGINLFCLQPNLNSRKESQALVK